MKCKKIQEWLMTDHWDGELSPAESAEVQQHMEGCSACREFEEMARGSLMAPFKGLAELQPDPVVWERVRGIIAEEEERSEGWFRKLQRVLASASRPLPAFRVAFVAAIVLVAIVLAKWPFTNAGPAYAYVEEQLVFMGELQSGNPDLLNGEPDVYESALEGITK